MRLLLVEDDKKAARALIRGLQEEGFVVDAAHSGDVGSEMAAATNYDLILLDWLLPRKDGLCRELRNNHPGGRSRESSPAQGRVPPRSPMIQTVRGRGFRLAAEAE